MFKPLKSKENFRFFQGEPLPADLLQPFSKAMNHASNDVKQLLAVIATFVAKSTQDVLPTELLKSLLVRLNLNRISCHQP